MNVEVVRAAEFQKHSEMSEVNAFAKVQTPWVSASFKFSRSHSHTEVHQGETMTMSVKYKAPVFRFDLLPHLAIKVESEDEGACLVNPSFIKAVKEAVEAAER